MVPFGSGFKTPSPGSSGKEPPFGGPPKMVLFYRTSRPGEPNLSGRKHPFRRRPEMVALSPDFKPWRSGVPIKDRITVAAEMVASAPFSSLPDAAPETAPSRGGPAI